MRSSALITMAAVSSAAYVPKAYGITSSVAANYNTLLPPALYNSDINSLRAPFYPAPTVSPTAAYVPSSSTSAISSASAAPASSSSHKHKHESASSAPAALSYTTKVVKEYTTLPCPSPTVVSVGTKVYTVTEATILTITDCDECTKTETIASATAPAALYTSPAAPYPTLSSSAAAPPVGTAPAPPISQSTGGPVASVVPSPFQPNAGSPTRLSFGGLVAALGFVVCFL